MTMEANGKLRREVDLIARFTDNYRRRFSTMIGRLNDGNSRATDLASLRLCVEAVDMMLASQKQLCSALAEVTEVRREAA